MKSWHPSRPSPAMVVALLSLCIALGGSAIAAKKVKLAPKNSVNSASVINNSLRLGDFKKSERSKLKGRKGAQGIQGPPGTPDGYTKAEADGTFLGKGDKAADSDKLDGIDSTGFVQGEGSQGFAQTVFADAASSSNFLALPGIGHIEFKCEGPMELRYVNESADSVQLLQNLMLNGVSPNLAGGTLPPTSGFYVTSLGAAGQVVVQFRRFHSVTLGINNQDSATLILSAMRGAPGDPASSCRVIAQVIHGHGSFNLLGTS